MDDKKLVAAVVRCGEYRRYDRDGEYVPCCGIGALTEPEEHDYCSYGEKRSATLTRQEAEVALGGGEGD